MKVLIVELDIFSQVGGGQSFYRALIEKNPHIHFTYFTRSAWRPVSPFPNVEVIPFKPTRPALDPSHPTVEGWAARYLVEAEDFARAVSGRTFDVVDVPDYNLVSAFIRGTFQRWNVKFDRLALSLHGRLSRAIECNSINPSRTQLSVESLRKLENIAYRAADMRYSISNAYSDLWFEETGIRAQVFDPLHFLKLQPADQRLAEKRIHPTEPVEPKLVVAGRKERMKGLDLAFELAWSLQPEWTGELFFVGPKPNIEESNLEREILAAAPQRKVRVRSFGCANMNDLREELAHQSLLLVPSRYDTLNLVALEGIFNGWPTVLSKNAGAARYLQEFHPNIPWVEFDPSNPSASRENVLMALRNIQEFQDTLSRALVHESLKPQGQSLEQVYDGGSKKDLSAISEALEIANRAEGVLNAIPNNWNTKFQTVRFHTRQALVRTIRNTPIEPIARGSKELVLVVRTKVRGLFDRNSISLARTRERATVILRQALHLMDFILLQVRSKEALPLVHNRRLGRIENHKNQFFEHLESNRLELAALAGLRVLRWAGSDRFHLLPRLQEILNGLGYKEEAKVAQMIFSESASAEDTAKYLLRRRESLKENNFPPPELLFDSRRPDFKPRVSVIVSAYNTRGKARHFLQLLQNQTLAAQNDVEIIYVDSHSPYPEIEDVKNCRFQKAGQFVFTRSQDRETIQQAWNRGIALARGEYLTFLGVDETVHPQALEKLANHLDANEIVDWVTASSIVSEVTSEGAWLRDVFFYNRTGFERELQYLDASYVNYVGGMYRRSLHDRFGYYDVSFKAAGDTEFKMRVLPQIEVACIPEVLGLFLNYPEERTTESPRAEIEDLRAWYLFRSEGGLLYSWNSRPSLLSVQRLARHALGYRKSYYDHQSTDIELANVAAQFAVNIDKAESSNSEEIARINEALTASRALELISTAPITQGTEAVFRLNRKFRGVVKGQAIGQVPKLFPNTRLVDPFRDNRYEQHSNEWR